MAKRWLRAAVGALLLHGVSVTGAEAGQRGGADTPTVYLQIGPAVTVHAEGEQYHRASPPLKGTTLGAAAAVGVRLVPAVALEIEAHVDSALAGAITDVYNRVTTYTAESRDLVVGLNLRFRSPGRVPVELAAGGGMAFSRFARRDIETTDAFFGGTTREPDRETSMHQPTASGSLAVAIPVSDAIELVPAVGARWIRRPFDTEPWYFGVGRYQVLASVSLRVVK